MSQALVGDRPAVVRLGTIVARNYIAQARVLWESAALVHPEIETTTLLVDGRDEDRELPGLGRVLLPSDLGIAKAELHVMMAIYDVMEFSTALKPSLLKYLLAEGAKVAAYFDPDIYFYARLDDLFARTAASGVSLTPHTVNPFPKDEHLVTERMVMWAGIYNLGYVAVSPQARVVLDWWGDRLLTHAISDPENALFTDQRWMDWAPALATPHIERGLGYNVAHWNLHEREITVDGSTVLAGGEPLRFLHFSGYDPGKPWLVSKHTAEDPRVLLSESIALKQLCDAYGEKLVASGHPQLRLMEYGLGRLPNGFRLTAQVRRFYRRVILGEIVSPTAPPDPFEHPDEFESWFVLRQFGSRIHPLSGLELALWASRPDLQNLFPRPLGSGGPAYVRWFAADPGAKEWEASIVRRRNIGRGRFGDPAARETSSPVTLVVSADHIGQPGRQYADGLAQVLNRSGVASSVVDASTFSANELIDPDVFETAALSEGSTLITCYSDQDGAGVRFALNVSAPRNLRSVAFVTGAPDRLIRTAMDEISLADEVWASSRWAAGELERLGRFTVRYVPVPLRRISGTGGVTVVAPSIADDDFVILCVASTSSSTWRIALEDTIKSFEIAFMEATRAKLVVTTDELPTEAREWLLDVVSRRADILPVYTAATSSSRSALIRRADCFVALDPATGITPLFAEVIASATPVIATTHPASRELLDFGSAELISGRETTVDSQPDPDSSVWLGAEVGHVARAMRSFLQHPSKGERLASRAQAGLAARFALASELMDAVLTPSARHSAIEIGTQE